MKPLKVFAVLALTSLGAVISPASKAAEPNDNVSNYLQLFRSDVNSVKVQLINSIMKLSDEEAKKFWPIYRDYENELSKLALGRATLVSEFVESHRNGSFDDAKAKDIAKRWFQSQKARLDLLEKSHGKIENALDSIHAGQFLQIENQVGLFIDLAIASEMPTVGFKSK